MGQKLMPEILPLHAKALFRYANMAGGWGISLVSVGLVHHLPRHAGVEFTTGWLGGEWPSKIIEYPLHRCSWL
jgi:hypothetical protein